MKKQIKIIAIVTLVTACSDEIDMSVSHVQQNEIDEIKEFVIPDSIDVKKEMVIAAYYEVHPQKACVIIAYSDSTKTSVKRYSYSSDSSFVVKDLVGVSYDEYKIKEEPSVSYIIKPNSVVWMHKNGSTASSAEFERIDLTK